jgi:hypothetical protein
MENTENSNYKVTVFRIDNLHPLDGLDRLVGTNIQGNQLLVGKETQIGDVGLYFPAESQLGEEFCVANDLLRRKDDQGKPAGGMFDQNRRVRVQKFKGHQSAGFWIPIESLHYLTTDHGKYPLIGHEFTEFQGQVICQKYIPKYNPNNHSGLGNGQGRKARESKIVDGQFHFHFDTAPLAKNVHKIDPEDLISVSWKLHGTSAVAAHVLCKPKLSRLKKFLIKVGLLDNKPNVYDYLYSSRKVIKNSFFESDKKLINSWDSNRMAQKKALVQIFQPDITDKRFREIFPVDNEESNIYTVDYMENALPGFKHFLENRSTDFYGYDLWADLGKKYFEGRLHKGESVYYEIVGMTKDNSYIQKDFDYSCEPKESKIYVYRMTHTNVDGSVIELQWNQVKERCTEMGVLHVPEVYYGPAKHMFPDLSLSEHWNQNFFDRLKSTYVYDQDCQFCKNVVPAEGIVVRKEGYMINVFKLKSFRFLEKETKDLDKGVVDIETQESIAEEAA